MKTTKTLLFFAFAAIMAFAAFAESTTMRIAPSSAGHSTRIVVVRAPAPAMPREVAAVPVCISDNRRSAEVTITVK
jgi:hypothetical protein